MSSGGGGKSYPRSDHSTHGQSLLTASESVKLNISKKDDAELVNQIVFAVLTVPDTTIKEQRAKLDKVGIRVISLDPSDPSRGIVSSEISNFKSLQDKILTYARSESHKGKSYFEAIKSFEEVDPIGKIDPILLEGDRKKDCIIYLYPNLTSQEQNRVLQDISFEISKSEHSHSEFVKTSVAGYALTATLSPTEIRSLVGNYYTILNVKFNSTLSFEEAQIGPLIPQGTTLAPPSSKIKVGVIDSGIVASPSFMSNTVAGRFSKIPSTGILDTSHGTLVASRVVFGNDIELQVGKSILQPTCQVVDIPIFWLDQQNTKKALTEAQIVNLLNEFIPNNPDVRIFNLSIGNQIPIRDSFISPLANELDKLSRDHDVLFVISAGNLIHNKHVDWTLYDTYLNSQTSRINSPADSLLGISVGSYATERYGNDIAPKNHISPFSRTGPGIDGGVKPELVDIGGNSYVYAGSGLYSPPSSACGLDAHGKSIAYNIGTSFSAPIVSHHAANILANDDSISINLLKAHLIHFADNSPFPTGVSNLPNHRYGFGKFENSLYASSNESAISFIYEGVIEKDNYVHIPIAIPSSIDKSSRKKLKMKFTVIYNPPVDGANPVEYSQTRLAYSLFKVFNGTSVEVSSSQNASRYSRPWNPTIKFERTFERNFSSGNWEIRLRLYSRGNLPDDFEQHFAVIVECTDETGKMHFYNDFLTEYGKNYSISTAQPGSAV